MKKNTPLLLCFLLGSFTYAQETVIELSSGPQYGQEVYLNLENENVTTVDATSWDIAFYRMESFVVGERINDASNIEVYEMSLDPSEYDAITPSDINESTSRFYNSDTDWKIGAFDRGEEPGNIFRFGWGVYNPVNHAVEGITTFILKYPDGNFKKFMIKKFSGGYTFKYASWNSATSAWEDAHEVVLPNSDNEGKLFNHYSLTNHTAVNYAPTLNDWDLVFQKYHSSEEMNTVWGALQNIDATVAISTDPNATASELEFSENINTVGHDWKTFNGTDYTVNSDLYYFLKRTDGSVYRFRFLSFDGDSTGNFSLAYENVSAQMNVEDFTLESTVALYPNPSIDGQVSLAFDSSSLGKTEVQVFNVTGQRVYSKELSGATNGRLDMDLAHLTSGMYLVKIQSGTQSLTKKLMLR